MEDKAVKFALLILALLSTEPKTYANVELVSKRGMAIASKYPLKTF